MKLNKSKTFPDDKTITAYGNRLGLSNRDVTKILRRLEIAYQVVAAKCEQDPRYQTDALLSNIKQAIKRTGLRDKTARRTR